MIRRKYKVKSVEEKMRVLRNQLYHANSSWGDEFRKNQQLKTRVAELETELAAMTKRYRVCLFSERTYKELAAKYIAEHAAILHEFEVS